MQHLVITSQCVAYTGFVHLELLVVLQAGQCVACLVLQLHQPRLLLKRSSLYRSCTALYRLVSRA